MKKEFNLFSVFMLMLLLLSIVSVQAQDTTLTVWYLSQSPEEIALVQELATEFEEANPGVTIDFSAYTYEDMNQTLSLALDAGTGPDIAYGSPGAQDADLYIEAGHLLDLTEIAEERGWTESFSSDVIEHYNPTEAVHVMPYDLVAVGVFYNKDLFAELELEPPQTFEEFDALLATLKEEGIAPISVGALDQWPLSHVWEQLVHVAAPIDIVASLEAGDPEATYESDGHLLATQKLQEWVENGYFQDNVLATSYADANSLFMNELTAMNIGGTWNNSTFATQPEFQVGFFPLPRLDPDIEWHMGGYSPNNVWMLPVYSENPDVAIDFVDFMLGERAAEAKWEAGDIVAYQFETIPEPLSSLQADVYDAMQETGTGFYIGQLDGELQGILWSALQELVNGSISPEEVLARTQDRYQEVVSE